MSNYGKLISDRIAKLEDDNLQLRQELNRFYKLEERCGYDFASAIEEMIVEIDQLNKYNSELCLKLTVTMDKLCLAEKRIIDLEENGKIVAEKLVDELRNNLTYTKQSDIIVLRKEI